METTEKKLPFPVEVHVRARLKAIDHLLNTLPASEDKHSPREMLKQGLVDKGLIPVYIPHVKEYLAQEHSHAPLTLSEITRFNTWFYFNPEKVAGEEVITTSRDFPVQVKGSKEDVIRVIEDAISRPRSTVHSPQLKANSQRPTAHSRGQSTVDRQLSKEKRMRLAKAKAAALELKLKLSKVNRPQSTVNGLTVDSGRSSVDNSKVDRGLSTVDKFPPLNPQTLALLKTMPFHPIGFNGLGRIKAKADKHTTLSPGEVDELYNKGITPEEKQAWVYYQMQRGEKMNGWEKYNPGQLTDAKAKSLMDAGALYYHKGILMPYPVYTYANSYDRVLDLEKDKEHIVRVYGHAAYELHVKALNEVKPKEISIQAQDVKDRPKILAISNFATDDTVFKVYALDEALVDIELPTDAATAGVSLQRAFSAWMKKLDKINFQNATAYEIQQYYLDARRFPNNMGEAEREKIEQYAPLEGEELFARFLYEALSPEDKVKLTFTWNRLYNGQSSVQYQRIPVLFTCSTTFKTAALAITPIQREGIAFMTAVGSGIIAYDVGVGKTMTAIVNLANSLYSGKCKRPVIVVPNQTYNKWLKELFGYTDPSTQQFVAGVLTGTEYTLNDWYNLGTDITKKLDLSKPVDEKSITVLTYEGFMRLGFSATLMDSTFIELSNIVHQVNEHKPDTKRDIAKLNQKLYEMIGGSNKETVVNVDGLGFDYLCVDEAHNYKNVFAYVPPDSEGHKRFKMDGGQSARAQKMFFIANYIQRTYGSNVMMLTATPFTNNPLEIYSMLSMVGIKNMAKYGVKNLFDFMETFINQSFEYAMTYQGDIAKKYVVKSFNNRLVLQRLIYNHINYKTGEEAGVKRPCKINLPRTTRTDVKTGQAVKLPPGEQLVTYLKMTEEQENNQAYINSYPDKFTRFEKMKAIMRSLSWNLDNALSPYIFTKTFPDTAKEFVDNSPKIKYAVECIRSVKQWHEKRGESVSGQVIYMNRGKEYFKFIVEYLQQEVGFNPSVKYKNTKVSEVEIITSEIVQTRREIIKEAFLDGVVKVIIGTATIREGIDLQRFGTALYNCYPDWNPTDAKQLEGRIWRQGNEFGYVRIVMPLVQDSMDVFVFQKLEEKTSRINDIWYRSDRGNVLDLESLDTEEVKFALYTNIGELTKIALEKEQRELNNKLSILQSQVETVNHLDADRAGLYKYREACGQQVEYWVSQLQLMVSDPREFAYQYGRDEDDVADATERGMEILKEIQTYKDNSQHTDKELLGLYRKMNQSVSVISTIASKAFRDFEYLKGYVGAMAKAEKTVFAAKGYSLNTDFELVKTQLVDELNTVYQQIEALNSPENIERITDEIIRKKEKLKVNGRVAVQAVEDFASLNYLLAYKFNQVDYASCIIPLPGKEPKPLPAATANNTAEDKEKRRRLALAKAAALELKLKLSNVA